MFIRSTVLLVGACAVVLPAAAVTIDAINVSTVAAYGERYTPTTYPTQNRFSLLGAAYSYNLSDGQVRDYGAGWTPYTNGHLASVTTADNTISYTFDQVNNWAVGSGTLFYVIGQVWCHTCGDTGVGLWTEGAFDPVSPVVITAQAGSATATLTGTARIYSNNAGSNWSGHPENFVAFSSPEGSVVSYSATYTLTDGSTWDEGVFNRPFTYTMTGAINLSPVPEPGTGALYLVALVGGLGLVRSRSKAGTPGQAHAA